ncbi:hypothetical protein NGA_0111202 [Nannochloropsis gaditana CCMP526]|uniref:uncharacterized protein n=1 Tax=Nannochloropsis gaditana (strain CCMP526) TaxID=1093141 RepID=UPI00029F6AD8|nr:hypothetical protein NGA_0111202 [Nannochloropsis gaditana CCMP526]XP_005855222.1 hypothetical protein NGA_0111201 [Nannochloropsis gaditana CCMP526]EKU21144.1 hypothetical protein NGA_0111201 [Nannochloropsis gaditana CCMP526]EKU22312.1 hypothetical protein NGA_0111202 [Nannochloropsis gaditana CCMP526]|eukprot:XP_005854053.1 hypothetical protein NGA_0111202 [Nannochloropsis gaditana CCMP526]
MCPRVLLAARSQRLRPLLFLLPAPNHPARLGRTLVLHKACTDVRMNNTSLIAVIYAILGVCMVQVGA